MSAPPLTLAENLVLMAGAGTGKTHSLIALALHALAGARPDGTPVAPSRLCAVTFTEKAAAEMKERLRERVRALADGIEGEPELFASFASLGRAAPRAAFWEEVHAELGGAFVGTFHALCADLLRRHAVEADVDPHFRLLDEAGSAELFDRIAERTILRALEEEGPGHHRVRSLVRALGFRGRGEHGAGLLDLLARIHAHLAEDGRRAEELPSPLPAQAFAGARDALSAALREELSRPALVALEALRSVAAARLEELSTLEPDKARQGLEIAAALRECIGLGAVPRAERERLRALRDERLSHFERACAQVLAAPLHADFLEALAHVEDCYQAEKERRGVLDFADLVRGARDLLREHASVRREAQARVSVLLVDEFQDTNRIQLDLVALLSERREGAPRAVSGSAFAALPLEPGMLACVGDPKQSIYEFRGADVSVFAELAARFQAGEGRVEYLTQNRRSRPALLSCFNALFASAMAPAPGDPPWRVGYRPAHDDLTPWRPEGPSGPCVELLRVAGASSQDRRALEARAVAARIEALLAPGAPPTVGLDRQAGELRRAQGRDIAVLFRRFTHLEVFRRELVARSIAHVIVRGAGFFGRLEVVDLRSLLSLLGNPADRLALACVLRSPLVTLSDASLARLALERRLSLGKLPDSLDLLEPGERERLACLLELFEWLRPASARMPLSEVLQAAVEALDLEAVLAASAEGEQRIANVRKLIDWARRAEPSDPWCAARRLEELAAGEGREAQASVLDESDPLAVRLMTIHQSKGLEFPVVFVPECGALPQAPKDAVLFDRQLGLCVRPLGEDERALPTLASEGIARALTSRQAAESERLLYVAATRARDLLVLSGEAGSRAGSSPRTRGPLKERPAADQFGSSWRVHLNAFVASPPSKGLVKVVDAVDPPAAASERGAPQKEAASGQVIRPMNLGLRPKALVLTLAQVLDHATCPRRFYLRHAVGLREANPAGLEPHRPAEGRTPGGPLVRGLEREGPSPRSLAGDMAHLAEGEVERLAALLRSGPFRGIDRIPEARLWQAVPAAVRFDLEGGAALVRGRLDLLAVLEDGTALVAGLSLGSSSRAEPERMALWRGWLGSVARVLLPVQVPLCVTLGFLEDASATEPSAPTAAERDAVREAVQALARRSLTRPLDSGLALLDLSRCRALRCGYVRFCHRPKSIASRSRNVV